MKKLILIAAMVFILSACDGLNPNIQNNPLMQPVHEYEVDTWGTNSEIYEFTPKSNANMTCIFLMLDSGRAMGLQCFPKVL